LLIRLIIAQYSPKNNPYNLINKENISFSKKTEIYTCINKKKLIPYRKKGGNHVF